MKNHLQLLLLTFCGLMAGGMGFHFTFVALEPIHGFKDAFLLAAVFAALPSSITTAYAITGLQKEGMADAVSTIIPAPHQK